MTQHFYITTPIYYVNDKPHIGHAYTSLACDVMARYKRLQGYEVKFLTGTDEHGQKVEKSAMRKGIEPQAFTDQVSQSFRDLTKAMHFSNDDFIRTTEERHKKGAAALWQRLMGNGHIYLDQYAGWYSVRDEAFFQESELIDGKAPSGAEVEWVEEPSYFFDLSKWQEKLLQYYQDNPDFIAPKSRRNEVISFVEGGLKDLSVSRASFSWGVPVPGDDKHVMYVWLDALTNYLSALGFPEESAEYQQFWPADLHVVGKDILRFHAVYWPAFLMAADLPLPKRIMAHGWWTNEGQKISKSIGNVIDPLDLIEQYGLDQTRFFLMHEVPFGNDGNFSQESMTQTVNSILANNIGNLSQRVLSMIQKNCDGNVPEAAIQEEDLALLDISGLLEEIEHAMQTQAFCHALKRLVAFASDANTYIDHQAPWTLKKTDPARMATVLYTLAEAIRKLAILLQPFMPDAAEKLLDQLAVSAQERDFAALENSLVAGTALPKPEPIFPRVELKEAC